jgi:hypothetical protein
MKCAWTAVFIAEIFRLTGMSTTDEGPLLETSHIIKFPCLFEN